MSSRALRKLRLEQNKYDLNLKAEEESKEETEEEEDDVELACTNKFLLLNEGEDDSEEPIQESASESEKADTQNAVASTSTKKKKKKRKKKKNSSNTAATDCGDNEDFDKILQKYDEECKTMIEEANRREKLLAKMKPPKKSVLDVEHRFLNIYNELQKIFGSQVLKKNKDYRRRQKGGSSSHKGVWLTQPAESWTKMIKVGLGMELVETEKDGTMYFKYVHSKEYQDVQFEFLDIVNSMSNGEHLHKLLVENQLNVDALITYSDFCTISEEVVMAREYIERALYVLERFFHPLFNLTTNKCRLDYKYPENRSLFICLFKHMHFVSRRGCNRTALELCKVLFNLDPKGDPLGAILLLDQFALNCGEYDFICRSFMEWGDNKNLEQLPNWAYSLALAEFQLATAAKVESETNRADLLLTDAILRFPTVLLKMLEKCSVQPDKKVEECDYLTKRAQESTTQGLELLCHLYVERTHSAWKAPHVLAWLERVVKESVLDILDKNEDVRIKRFAKQRKRRYQKAPLNIHRHAMLSDLPGVSSYVPIEIRSLTMLGHDPLPPTDTVVSYSRPERATGGQRAQQNSLGLFFNSMLPDYDLANGAAAAEGPLQRNQDQIRAGVRQLMQAMRDLLVIPYVDPNQDPEEDAEEDVPFNDWE